MTDFIINPRVNYPFILTDASKELVYISGISIPENPSQFYMPLLGWIDDFLTNISNSLTVNFELMYFGNTTSKAFFDLFSMLEKHSTKGKLVKVNWFYHPDDEDIMEDGEEFADFFHFPFNIEEKPAVTSFNHKRTATSPLVYFDQSGDIVIEGPSINEKPWDYFYPVIMWLDTIRFSSLGIGINADFNISKADKLNLQFIGVLVKEFELINDKESKNVMLVWKYANDEIKAIGDDILLKSTINFRFEKV